MAIRFNPFAAICLLCVSAVTSWSCKKNDGAKILSTETNYSIEDKRLFFIYGPLIRSISVSDVETFTSKGIANGDIGNIIKLGKLNPETLRAQLTTEYKLDMVETSNILNSPVGVALLNKLGEAVHPHLTRTGSAQAVRAAIVMALRDDNTLTPLEVLKNLPVNMDVDIAAILKLKEELSSVFARG